MKGWTNYPCKCGGQVYEEWDWYGNDIKCDNCENPIPKEEDVENSNYLVLVLKDFCFDGQITENDYCLHLVDSEHIDHCDYDKRDFNGEFVLGVYNTSSIDKAIGLASLEYEMEEDMLKAYKLA